MAHFGRFLHLGLAFLSGFLALGSPALEVGGPLLVGENPAIGIVNLLHPLVAGGIVHIVVLHP